MSDDISNDVIREGSLEMAMLRRLLYRLGGVAAEDLDTDLVEATNNAIDRIDRLEARIEEIEAKSDTALGVARVIDDGARSDGGPSKIERARRLSRNEVIRQTATQGQVYNEPEGKRIEHRLGSITNGDVQDMAKPETDLKWQTIDDAWNDLCRDWDCFEIDDTKEPKEFTVTSVDVIPQELVRVVEADLDRDDLAKTLVGGSAPGRGSP